VRGRRAGTSSALPVFIVMVFPVFWMISTAFKSNDQIVSLTPTWFPLHPTLQHFRDAINKPFFWEDVKNSPDRGHGHRRDLESCWPSSPRSRSRAIASAAQALRKWLVYRHSRMLAAGRPDHPRSTSSSRATTQVNALTGLIVNLHDFRVAVLRLDAARLPDRDPKELEEAAMVDGSTRVGVS